jgi:hypothetical protein
MTLIKDLPDDTGLVEMVIENNLYAWHCIYDKYAALMYGNILCITQDRLLAEKIFINAFTSLKEDKNFISANCSMPLFLCMYAKKFKNQYLQFKQDKAAG